jgi:hypothetical protein
MHEPIADCLKVLLERHSFTSMVAWRCPVCGRHYSFDRDDQGRPFMRGESHKATAQDLVRLAGLMGFEAPDAGDEEEFAARFLALLREQRRPPHSDN